MHPYRKLTLNCQFRGSLADDESPAVIVLRDVPLFEKAQSQEALRNEADGCRV